MMLGERALIYIKANPLNNRMEQLKQGNLGRD